MNIYRSATTGEIARRAAKYVKQSAPVAADPKTLAPAKRGRGRPSNAELGRDAALSQVERNRRYRARKAAAAVTVPRALADRLAAARSARGQTIDALLTQALDALGA